MAAIDIPCDFDVFVAEQLRISVEAARDVIRVWLAGYVPYAKVAESPVPLVAAGVADEAVCNHEDQARQ